MNKNPFTSIRSRILIYTISIILLFGTIIGGLVYYVISSNAEYTLIRESETSLLYAASSIDNNIEGILSFIQSSQISKHITSYVLEDSPGTNVTRKDAHDFLQDTYAANSNLRDTMIRVIIIGNNREDIVQSVEPAYSSANISKQMILSQNFFSEALDADRNPVSIVKDPFLPAQNIDMVPFIFKIAHPYRADYVGYVFAEMSTKAFIDPIKTALPSDNEDYYIKMGDKLYKYENGNLVLSSEVLFPDNNVDSSDFTIYKGQNSDKGKYLAASYPLCIDDWYVIRCSKSGDALYRSSSVFMYLIIIVILFLIFIGGILYRLLYQMVNIPVLKLTERIERIEMGDFTRDPETEWNNELGDIGRTINNLSENVYSLMNQRIEDEKQKKDYEYQILQSQINPHFLYNTLNSIKWMATIQNAPGIAEMTTALSRLLKDISKGTNRIITLEHELALVDDYFTIQKYRYGGTISLTKDIENDNLLDCNILRFSLQPLIENSIFHGIEPKGTSGTISIKVYRRDDVYIEVTDDGIGMDNNLAQEFLDGTHTTSSSFFKEIGIGNVNKRLKYEFGDKYGLSIDSKVGEYTKITICIPYNNEEEDTDESSNS